MGEERQQRGRGRGSWRGRGRQRNIPNDIWAILVDRVISHGMSMREAGWRVQPHLCHHIGCRYHHLCCYIGPCQFPLCTWHTRTVHHIHTSRCSFHHIPNSSVQLRNFFSVVVEGIWSEPISKSESSRDNAWSPWSYHCRVMSRVDLSL